MAEGIGQRSAAVAVELVLQRAQLLAARRQRAFPDLVHVLAVDHQMHRRRSLGGTGSVLRRLVGEHEDRVSDAHLGMADPSTRRRHPEQLLGAERPLVEVERFRRAVDDQVGRKGVISIGNRLGHGDLRRVVQRAPAMMRAKSSAFKLAPPTSAPSMSGWASRSAAFSGFTDPPYWIRTAPATWGPARSRSRPRICPCTSCACAVVAVFQVPQMNFRLAMKSPAADQPPRPPSTPRIRVSKPKRTWRSWRAWRLK